MRTIRECLQKMTIRQFRDIAFRLELTPPKDEGRSSWIQLLEEKITSDPADLYGSIGRSGWDALKPYLEGASGEIAVPIYAANDSEPLRDALEMLRLYGLAWRDRKSWHINPYVAGVLPRSDKVWEQLQNDDIIVTIAMGYLRIYGMLPKDRLIAMMLGDTAQKERERTENYIIWLILHRWGIDCMLMVGKDIWFVLPYLDDPSDLYREIRKSEDEAPDYACYSQEEAIVCGRGGLIGHSEDYREALAVYRRHHVSEHDAMQVLADAATFFQESMLEEAYSTLCDPFEHPLTPRETNVLSEVLLHVPLWHLKGHTLYDTGLRVGPVKPGGIKLTDPCPCGSGRQYGKCCGRFQ